MVKIFGERLRLVEEPKEDKLIGGIKVPESAKRGYAFCRVAEIGNGILDGTKKSPPPDLAAGDVVLVQINPQMAASSAHIIDGKRSFVCHWHDALGVVVGDEITFNGFRPIGRWVLVKVDIEDNAGPIIIPNQNMQNAVTKVTYTLVKQGQLAKEQLGLEVGTEVLVDKARANPLTIERQRYAYVDADYVTGAFSA